jgi:hypothetical protein
MWCLCAGTFTVRLPLGPMTDCCARCGDPGQLSGWGFVTGAFQLALSSSESACAGKRRAISLCIVFARHCLSRCCNQITLNLCRLAGNRLEVHPPRRLGTDTCRQSSTRNASYNRPAEAGQDLQRNTSNGAQTARPLINSDWQCLLPSGAAGDASLRWTCRPRCGCGSPAGSAFPTSEQTNVVTRVHNGYDSTSSIQHLCVKAIVSNRVPK